MLPWRLTRPEQRIWILPNACNLFKCLHRRARSGAKDGFPGRRPGGASSGMRGPRGGQPSSAKGAPALSVSQDCGDCSSFPSPDSEPASRRPFLVDPSVTLRWPPRSPPALPGPHSLRSCRPMSPVCGDRGPEESPGGCKQKAHELAGSGGTGTPPPLGRKVGTGEGRAREGEMIEEWVRIFHLSKSQIKGHKTFSSEQIKKWS